MVDEISFKAPPIICLGAFLANILSVIAFAELGRLLTMLVGEVLYQPTALLTL